MKVKIKAGTYGWRDHNGMLKPKKAGEICEVDAEEGERLSLLGVAEILAEEPEEERAENPEAIAPAPRYDRETLSDMKLAGLRILCETNGAPSPRTMKKEECIAFLLGEAQDE